MKFKHIFQELWKWIKGLSIPNKFDFAVAIIAFCIYLPTLLYFGKKYYRKRKHVAVKQRYGYITLMEITCSCISICTFGIFNFINNYNNFDANLNRKSYNIVYIIILLLLGLFTPLVYVGWAWRFFMISYDMKFEIATNNKQWQYIINPSSIQLTESKWIIQKKNTYGNARWIGKHFILPWVVFWFIYTAVLITRYANNSTIGGIFFAIGAFFNEYSLYIALVIIYWKIPRFNDHFYISDELKRVIITYTIIPLCDLGSGIYQIISKQTTGWPFTLNIFIDITTMTLVSLISTQWVLKKLKPIMIAKKTIEQANALDVQQKLNDSLCSNEDLLASIQSYELKNAMTSSKTFETFMRYLSKELSSKFLLAFVEIIQIQHFIMKQSIMH
eukprot:137461_1